MVFLEAEAGILLKDESQSTDNLLRQTLGGQTQTQVEDELNILEDRAMIAELLQDSDKMVKLLKIVFDLSEQAGEHGLSDFIAGRMDAHRKHSWQLRATSKE